MNNIWLLALGGNLPSAIGGPEVTLKSACASLRQFNLKLCKVSRFYETPCFPPGAGPDYINAAAMVETPLDAHDMLAVLHEVEAEFGRERDQRWGMRTLDIDLIGGQDLVLPDPETHRKWTSLPPQEQVRATPDQLILPHPRLQDRAFVLVPLNDIAPDWVHPATGRSVSEMLAALPESDRKAVIPL
ncbi:2-amino-4-hydroxy-6-hydroxymethyldihydropteridine diphosphokinase [Shimia sp. SDUM112013]|uniref:2-amino-4-hydroxy-6- hydroxymethyldihydropteridine diphosphokinase n=1 Tax=Shimia sp. SDUM112013 TaxID=3136160 RepID=UPI0032EE44AF